MKPARWAAAGLLAVLASGAVANGQEDNWPDRPIEFVVTTAAGTGSDIISRLIADVVQQEKLLPQPIVVVNKPGSGGSVAMPYVFEKKGDAYTVLVGASDTILSTPQRTEVPYTYKSFKPIANLAADGSLVVVRADSPYKTIDDLFADAKARSEEIMQGGGSYAGTDGINYELLQKATGAKWNFVSFQGSGPESLLNLINGSVDFVTPNP
jgi:putative tricarboxylic transport membrane protein